ncbi:alpha/beta hydrolase [Lacticaseibacillus nasuensis]|uniref:Alpha beta fold family hydrolase n=1 Tax=Lacticaseibacillus nasuensis JCM 17158 TaxID=1291734 RepID=A0A0R1JRS0_9LACO|nr:alpha/beta hydrolase [Lacticaseibacillus nasuensis]KRK70945.1 alpha beta fold family hydrolase [Lacticaseibacillus nasuensis JCM 17158]
MQKKRSHRRLWRALVIIGGLLIVSLLGISLYFYQYAFVPSKKTFLSSHEPQVQQRARQWLSTVPKETWHETAAGAKLRLVADYVPAAKPTTRTVVIAHGYMNTKESQADKIRLFHQLGYNVLAPDDRGHGQSQGNYIGYGWPDRLDYVKWIKQLLKREGSHQQIALYGVSMGGATVMYMSGERLPKQVRAIIEDCGYTNIVDELAYQAKAQFGIPKYPLVPVVAAVATVRTGYNVFAASAPKQLAKNHLPILFIHGAKDKFVPTKMAYENYRATSAPKKLWIVPNAGHAQSYEKNQVKYTKLVKAWLKRYL